MTGDAILAMLGAVSDLRHQPGTHVIGAAGFSWLVEDNPDADDRYGPSRHEACLEPVFRDLLGQGRTFLDIGAHIGYWTVRMAPQAGKVIAVEPHPDTARLLRENIRLNKLENITVIEAAAWDRDEPLRFEDPLGRIRSGTNRTVPGAGGTVRGHRLDDLISEDIHVVKMDTEGADLHVLRGMKGILTRSRPAMLIERHDFLGCYDAGELFALLDEYGYAWRDAPHYAGIEVPHLIAEPRG